MFFSIGIIVVLLCVAVFALKGAYDIMNCRFIVRPTENATTFTYNPSEHDGFAGMARLKVKMEEGSLKKVSIFSHGTLGIYYLGDVQLNVDAEGFFWTYLRNPVVFSFCQHDKKNEIIDGEIKVEIDSFGINENSNEVVFRPLPLIHRSGLWQ